MSSNTLSPMVPAPRGLVAEVRDQVFLIGGQGDALSVLSQAVQGTPG